MFGLLIAIFWFIVIACIIRLLIDVVRGTPVFFRGLRLKNAEEAWRLKKEEEYDQSLWNVTDKRMHELYKGNNPYRKDYYYLFPQEERKFFMEENSKNIK